MQILKIISTVSNVWRIFSEYFPGWVILSFPELAEAQPLLCRLCPFQAAMLWTFWVCHPKSTAVTLRSSVLPCVLKGWCRALIFPANQPSKGLLSTPAAQAEQGKLGYAHPSSLCPHKSKQPQAAGELGLLQPGSTSFQLFFISGSSQSLHTAVRWYLHHKGQKVFVLQMWVWQEPGQN